MIMCNINNNIIMCNNINDINININEILLMCVMYVMIIIM